MIEGDKRGISNVHSEEQTQGKSNSSNSVFDSHPSNESMNKSSESVLINLVLSVSSVTSITIELTSVSEAEISLSRNEDEMLGDTLRAGLAVHDEVAIIFLNLNS